MSLARPMMNTWPTSSAVANVLLALGLLFAAGCASADPVVKVGLVAPFEGRNRAVGYDAIYSARLAVREINQAGGIGGHRVALVALDDRGDPQLAVEAAASLVLDPGVVAVVGHFLPQTTDVVASLYDERGLALIAAGDHPLMPGDPQMLPQAFIDAYEAVTPFDESAGPYAGVTFDAFELLWAALAVAEQNTGEIDRASVQEALRGLEYDGMTGVIFQP
jgi:ABC-type branched-subunit amino acid transport system substrate-binding protein